MYLTNFTFPSTDDEDDFFFSLRRTCYNSFYPFRIVSKHHLRMLDFESVTILYGGNGSGKTTVLNVIAEKLELKRDTLFNRSSFFNTYTDMCKYILDDEVSADSRIITSDDVFDFMLNLRNLNEGIDDKRKDLLEEYQYNKHTSFKMKSLDDYEQLKSIVDARRKTGSKYVRDNLMENVKEHSNGESAFMYFSEKIKENSLYLLDEPENSLSPEKQQELLKFIEDSARFFGCQFIIATHSPFLLSMKNAKIYDLDEEYVDIKKWTELENVRTYYEFFKEHEKEF